MGESGVLKAQRSKTTFKRHREQENSPTKSRRLVSSSLTGRMESQLAISASPTHNAAVSQV
jgi:hypothetical protein